MSFTPRQRPIKTFCVPSARTAGTSPKAVHSAEGTISSSLAQGIMLATGAIRSVWTKEPRTSSGVQGLSLGVVPASANVGAPVFRK